MKKLMRILAAPFLLIFAVSCSLGVTPEGAQAESAATRGVVPATDVATTFKIDSWGATFNGTIYIQNKGTTPIEKWTLSFDYDYEITSNWGCEIVSRTGSKYELKSLAWNENIAPGETISFGVGGNVTAGAAITTPQNAVVTSGGGTGTGTVQGPVLPAGPSGKLEMVYKTMVDEATKMEGIFAIGNVNDVYYWNAYMFDIRNITFETTGTVTQIKQNPWGQIEFTQTGNLVTLNLKHLSYIGIAEGYDFTIYVDKNGAAPEPANFKVSYMRGDHIRYPDYGTLPASWQKGKTNLTSADLIANAADYYSTAVAPTTDKFVVYNPNHKTQIHINQIMQANYPVNTETDVRIHMYSKNMALGTALTYEFLKLNPNYMVALGTKENMSSGFITRSNGHDRPVMIDGVQYYWNMKFPSDAPTAESNFHDGPYQQEPGNFADARIHMHDYLGPNAQHSDIVSPNMVDDLNDPKFITATFSAGLSVTMTRELLYAICDYNNVDYNYFMDNATDRDAELKIVTYAYNRGYGMFLGKGIFGDKRTEAMATADLVTAYDMGGFGAHVPTVNAVVTQMNADTSDIYDAQLTWADMETFLAQLRKFYAKGIPTDAEWTAMTADVQAAFNVLKAHWGNNTVSYRYDFLTLLRVAKKHLPEINPRPTGNAWFYNVQGATINSRQQ